MLVVSSFVFNSCYKDLSTEAEVELPDIIITSDDDDGVLNVSYGEEFVFEPQVFQEGSTDGDFTYLWEIDLIPGNLKDRIQIGTEQKLEYKVGNAPSDKPYFLSLTVMNKNTGLSELKYWKVYISSSLGEGILVAHTRDNGKSSELDLVSDKNITWGYTGSEVRYVRDLYAFANGDSYPGKIDALSSTAFSTSASFNHRAILIGGEGGYVELDPLNYKISRKDREMFYTTNDTEFNVTEIFNFAGYISGCIVNNRLYSAVCNSSDSYNVVMIPKKPDNIFDGRNIAYTKAIGGSICFFDKVHGEILYTRGWMLHSGGLASADLKPASFNVAESDVLAGGSFKDFNLAFVVKKNTGGHCLYTLNLQGFESITSEYELDAPEIDKAISFAFCENCNVFYYTTEESIYSNTIVGGNVVTKKVNWKPDSPDEKITSIYHYQQAWYGTHQYSDEYEFVLPMHQLMMLMTTYNEKTGEGKIYPRMFNVTTGLFTFKTFKPYDGFGKIQTMTTTFK